MRWEALRILKNGRTWSRMVTWLLLGRLGGSLEVQNGRRIVQERSLEVLVRVSGSSHRADGVVLRGLGRVSGGLQRVHGVSWDGPERACKGFWRS